MNSEAKKFSLFGMRFKAACEEKKLTQQQVADLIGVSKTTVNGYATGAQLPAGENLLAIQSALNVSIDWLLTGQEPNSSPWSDGYVEVPLYEAKLSGGHGADVISEKPVDRLSFKRDWFIGQKGMDPEEAALMFVTGDSMEPTFYDGDLVLINKANKTIYGGGVYAVRWENRLIIKRLSLSAPGKLRVASDNEKFYPPIEVDADNSVEVIGKVVWFCRDLRM